MYNIILQKKKFNYAMLIDHCHKGYLCNNNIKR